MVLEIIFYQRYFGTVNRMQRILLIFPDIPKKFETTQWMYPNLALIQLGTILKNADYEPILLNIPQSKILDIPYTDILQNLSGISAACISAYSFQLNIVKKLIHTFKEHQIPVILGGALASTSPAEALQYCDADYAVEGEGDISLPRLLDFLLKGNIKIEEIGNLWYKNNGKLKFTFNMLIEDLDTLPILDFKLQNYEELFQKIFNKSEIAFFPLESSRGCYANCTFCSSKRIMGHWRKKSPERLLNEIFLLQEAYPRLFKHQNFGVIYIDNTATADPKRILKFAKLKRDADLTVFWTCMSRINEFLPNRTELISAMTESGNRSIFFGIEAGYNEGLKRIHKRITIEQIDKIVKLWIKYGLSILNLSFIVGFPWETMDEIEQTLNYAKALKQLSPNRIKVSISYFNLFKRTQLYEDLKKQYADELNLDELTSIDLIDRNWCKVPKRAVLYKIHEFDEFNRRFDLKLQADEFIDL